MTWSFRLILDGLDVADDAQLDALFEAGCDDAQFALVNGICEAVFDREDVTAEAAVLSGISAIEGAGAGVRVLRVEPEDEWVTAAEIAERTDRSRESVRLLIQGRRGPGDFPQPFARKDTRNPLWSWQRVHDWFSHYDPSALPPHGTGHPAADFVAELNDLLDLRERRRRLPDAPWRSELERYSRSA